MAALFVLWQLSAHSGKHNGAPTRQPQRAEALEQWHDSASENKAAEIASQSVPAPRAELVVAGELPDRAKTPGDVFPNITVNDLRVRGYSKKVRNVPAELRREALAEYGVPEAKRYDVECDHLIPLAWGGSNSQKNLWAEPWHLNVNGKDLGAHPKDQLEQRGLELIREGRLDLHEAQREISTNWVKMYERLIGPLPDYREAG